VLVTLVILKWSWRYLFARERAIVEPTGPVQVFPKAEPAQKQVAVRHALVLTETKAVVPTAKLETGLERERAPEFSIECGNCGKEIKSPQIGQQLQPGTQATVAIYECEHCHSRVAVPD
jgi:DNA-directed RNA polymerase subunit RPC12/RpoP